MTRREARQWIRGHWAQQIEWSDMPDLPPEYDDAISEVWSDESARIAARIRPRGTR